MGLSSPNRQRHLQQLCRLLKAHWVVDENSRLLAPLPEFLAPCLPKQLFLHEGYLLSDDDALARGLHEALASKPLEQAKIVRLLGREGLLVVRGLEQSSVDESSHGEQWVGFITWVTERAVLAYSSQEAAMQSLAQCWGLTPAEENVLSALTRHNDAEEVANRLKVSIGTVRTHIKKVLGKSGCRNLRGLMLTVVQAAT